MVSSGDTAPTFTATYNGSDHETFELDEHLGDGPVVLAFFPGAFTSVCSHEMEAFDDRLDDIADAGATIYGISIDTPFAQNAFRDELGLGFGLVSDNARAIVDDYGIAMDFTSLGVYNLAKRAVFVVDSDRKVTYAWVSDDPAVEPNYDEVVSAVQAV